MTTAKFHEVIKLAEELEYEEQQALITHLQEIGKKPELNESERQTRIRQLLDTADQRELAYDEWVELHELSIIRNVVMLEDFPIRREDMVDDDGR